MTRWSKDTWGPACAFQAWLPRLVSMTLGTESRRPNLCFCFQLLPSCELTPGQAFRDPRLQRWGDGVRTAHDRDNCPNGGPTVKARTAAPPCPPPQGHRLRACSLYIGHEGTRMETATPDAIPTHVGARVVCADDESQSHGPGLRL